MNKDEKMDEKINIEEKLSKCKQDIEILKMQIQQRRRQNFDNQILEESKENDMQNASETNHLYNAYCSYDISADVNSYNDSSSHLPHLANDTSTYNSVKSTSSASTFDSSISTPNLKLQKSSKKVSGNSNGIYKRIADENDSMKNSKNRDVSLIKYDHDNRPNINIKNNILFSINKSFTGHIGKIYTFEMDAFDNEIISCGQDGLLIVWNIDTGNKRTMVKLESKFMSTSAYCTYNKSKQIIACGGLSKICYVYDLTDKHGLQENGNKHLIASLSGHRAYISCIKFIDDNRLITASGDSTCILWDIEYNKSVQIFENSLYSKSDITGIDIVNKTNKDANGYMFISGSVDGYIRLYDIRKTEKRGYIAKFGDNKCQINMVKCFENDTSFVSGYEDGHVRFYDLRSFGQMNYYGMDDAVLDDVSRQKVNGISCIDFSKSGSFMFNVFESKESSNQNEKNKINNCVVRHTITGRKIGNLNCESPITWLKVASNGQFVVTSHLNKSIKIWESYMQTKNNTCSCF
eukprot:126529_1